MTDLSLLRVFLFCKDVIKEVRNVNEIVFFLENKYLPHIEERGTFIEDIPSQECLFAFGEMSDSERRCWVDGYQWLQKYSDTKKICLA